MKKKANIGFTVLIALIIVCCGAAVLSIAGNSKYNAKTEYQRIEDRYIAESGVDLSVGLFLNYLSKKDLVLKEGVRAPPFCMLEETFCPLSIFLLHIIYSDFIFLCITEKNI